MHRRTLQRRLEVQGLYFEDIVDLVRRKRADQLLPHAAIPLTEIYQLLGYTEQSSFSRACRRWYGATPLATRQRLQRRGVARTGSRPVKKTSPRGAVRSRTHSQR
jgi:AraC-like DNA-binding protein